MLIINPIPGQEEENAEFLESKGVGIWLKKSDDISRVLKLLLSDSNKLAKMKENALLLGHLDSTKVICDVLMK